MLAGWGMVREAEHTGTGNDPLAASHQFRQLHFCDGPKTFVDVFPEVGL